MKINSLNWLTWVSIKELGHVVDSTANGDHQRFRSVMLGQLRPLHGLFALCHYGLWLYSGLAHFLSLLELKMA